MANRLADICMWLPSNMALTELTSTKILDSEVLRGQSLIMFNVSKSVQEEIKYEFLQRQFGKDFHTLEFFIYNSIPRTHMVDKSLVLQWKSAVSKMVKKPNCCQRNI